jgi:hypothetical protein
MLLFFLTKEQYGLFQLVGSMIAYLTIMDFGLAIPSLVTTQDILPKVMKNPRKIYSQLRYAYTSLFL